MLTVFVAIFFECRIHVHLVCTLVLQSVRVCLKDIKNKISIQMGGEENTNPVALRFPVFSRDVHALISRHMDSTNFA